MTHRHSVGVREATFHIDKLEGSSEEIGVGVIPVSKASSTDEAEEIGYMLYNDGTYYARSDDGDLEQKLGDCFRTEMGGAGWEGGDCDVGE